jgi:hypothetical protein
MSSPSLNFAASIVGSVGGAAATGSGTSLSQAVNIQALMQLLPGTGGGQADTIYETTATIAASGTLTLDLNGTLTDPFGATVNLLHVKAIYIQADAGNSAAVQMAPGSSNPFNGPLAGTSPTLAIAAGEFYLHTNGSGSNAGWAVVASTGDILRIINTSGSASAKVTVVIIGTST